MSGNGAISPYAPNLPIVGQASSIGATITNIAKCPCGAALALLSQLVNGQLQSVPNTCACGVTYAVAGIAVSPQGAVSFQITPVARPA